MKTKHIILIVVMLSLFIIPFVISPSAEFSSADTVVKQLIEDQGYEPWINSIWVPPSPEIESLLFAVQAGIGGLIVGYYIGHFRREKSKELNVHESIIKRKERV